MTRNESSSKSRRKPLSQVRLERDVERYVRAHAKKFDRTIQAEVNRTLRDHYMSRASLSPA